MIMMIREQELKDQARAEGREEGRTEGRQEGRQEGETRLGRLIERLFALGRGQDAARAASDPEYRRQLYEALDI